MAAPPASPSLPELRSQVTRARGEQLRAARDYKASLERLLVLREHDVQRALEQRDRTRELVDRGIVARNDLETSERAVDIARARLDQTWNEAVVAASLITKALAYEELASARTWKPSEHIPLGDESKRDSIRPPEIRPPGPPRWNA